MCGSVKYSVVKMGDETNESKLKSETKGVSLRLRRICSTDEEFNERSKEYKAYSVARGHNPASVLKEFDRTANLTRTQARVKRSDNRDKPKRLTTCNNKQYSLLCSPTLSVNA